ncbi:DeoR family transcriptional regulator [Blautia producta]|uniref:DeoR family transcriptional regulator n=1 Tax=Blautia producta TaxID=33035 RepID=UPI001D08CE06|nr:DeoR family transcriptional regulator [Blautia producta]
MLKEKRIQQIYELIKRDGQVEISELGKMFNVTEMTIRRDLESLSEMYHIVRTHGGGLCCPPVRKARNCPMSGEWYPRRRKRKELP